MNRAQQIGLEQRLRWLVDSGRARARGALSLGAGLTRQHIDTYLARCEKWRALPPDERKEKGPPDMNVSSVVAIAEAARVDFAWLATGRGTPDGEGANDPDREAAIALLSDEEDVDQKALAILRQQPSSSAIGIDGWFARYREICGARDRAKEVVVGNGVDSSGLRKKRAL